MITHCGIITKSTSRADDGQLLYVAYTYIEAVKYNACGTWNWCNFTILYTMYIMFITYVVYTEGLSIKFI